MARALGRRIWYRKGINGGRINTVDYMHQALKLAEACAQCGEVPVGAVLVCEGKVIGRGANSRERSGRTVSHAEIMALEDYTAQTGQWRVPVNTSLFVTAEPCLMCTGALIWARVSEIYYGCEDPKGAGLRTLLPLIEAGTYDHRFKSVTGGIEKEAAANLLKDFFKKQRQSKVDKP